MNINLTFTDKEDKRQNIKIEYNRYMSFTNDHGQGEFKPANSAQKELKQLWKLNHLKVLILSEQEEIWKKINKTVEIIKQYEEKHLKNAVLLKDTQEHLDLVNDQCHNLSYEEAEKYLALLIYMGLYDIDIDPKIKWYSYIETKGEEYRVFTDAEADEAEEEYLYDLVDDLLPREFIESNMFAYFNTEAFVEDNKGNRGNNLANYNGEEHSVTVNKTKYFIYRNN